MDGIIIINKPMGMTSHDVINKLRKHFHQKKFGHTGTLDPNATGVLVVLCGKACKVLQFLQDTDKTYRATIQLGCSTSTDDIWGEKLASKEVNRDFDFKEELNKFIGNQHQKVPMTSAKKINGKKLMEYQRESIEVEPVYQDIEIYDIFSLSDKDLLFQVHCSGGTYVRSICRDLALNTDNLGCMSSLIRTQVGRFHIEQAQTLDEIYENGPIIYPVKEVLTHIPSIELENIDPILQGKRISLPCDYEQVCITYDGQPIAIYNYVADHVYAPKRGLW